MCDYMNLVTSGAAIGLAERQGGMVVKDLGPMRTYWLGPPPAAAAAAEAAEIARGDRCGRGALAQPAAS